MTDASDAAPDAPAVTVAYDLTGVVPYVPLDFADSPRTYDNAPPTRCTLHPPFAAPLAVVAGRALIEIPASGALVVHDYRPGANDSTGPDNVDACLFAATPSRGRCCGSEASRRTRAMVCTTPVPTGRWCAT